MPRKGTTIALTTVVGICPAISENSRQLPELKGQCIGFGEMLKWLEWGNSATEAGVVWINRTQAFGTRDCFGENPDSGGVRVLGWERSQQ